MSYQKAVKQIFTYKNIYSLRSNVSCQALWIGQGRCVLRSEMKQTIILIHARSSTLLRLVERRCREGGLGVLVAKRMIRRGFAASSFYILKKFWRKPRRDGMVKTDKNSIVGIILYEIPNDNNIYRSNKLFTKNITFIFIKI